MSTKDQQTYARILDVYEDRSTCKRLHVACAIVKDGRNIVSGWNGALSGYKHCIDHFKDHTVEELNTELNQTHREWSTMHELHAEQNCIAYAAKNGIAVGESDLYVSYSPCLDCAKLIAAAGIKRVFYKHQYDRYPQGVDYLNDHKIPTKQLIYTNKEQEVCM